MLAIDNWLDLSATPGTLSAEIEQHNQSLQWPVFTRASVAGFDHAMIRQRSRGGRHVISHLNPVGSAARGHRLVRQAVTSGVA
jgi:hypothetical protein